MMVLSRQLGLKRGQQRFGVSAELGRDLVARPSGIERSAIRPGQQGERLLGRHEERDELGAEIARDVYADDVAGCVQSRPARHAGVERARVVHTRLERVLDPTVADPLSDGEADIERKAYGEGALAL